MKELICVGCPLGCILQVETDGKDIRSVKGHACNRGSQYARDEVLRPKRMLTSLIPVAGSRTPLSVRTRAAIPKDLIGPALCHIRTIRVSLPVRIGDVIEANFLETGVDLIATRNLP